MLPLILKQTATSVKMALYMPIRPRFLSATFAFSLCLLCGLHTYALAQTEQVISGKAYADTATHIMTQGEGGLQWLELWGIDPAFEATAPEAATIRTFMNQAINAAPVRCTVRGTPSAYPQPAASYKAQCLTGQDRDLAVLLLEAGYVMTDPRDLAGSDLLKTYMDAEQKAQTANAGIWGKAGDAQVAATTPVAAQANLLPLTAEQQWLISAGIQLLFLLTFICLALMLLKGMRDIAHLQKHQISGAQRREKQAKERDKYVLAAALDAELKNNRAKLDAFLGIYSEQIRGLRDPSKTPKYKRGGDVIHEKPALSRTAYDSHIDKLPLLGPQLAADISLLYSQIDANPEYKTLEPEMPVEKVLEAVDKIVRNAEKLGDPMDKISGALNVMLRDRTPSPQR